MPTYPAHPHPCSARWCSNQITERSMHSTTCKTTSPNPVCNKYASPGVPATSSIRLSGKHACTLFSSIHSRVGDIEKAFHGAISLLLAVPGNERVATLWKSLEVGCVATIVRWLWNTKNCMNASGRHFEYFKSNIAVPELQLLSSDGNFHPRLVDP